MIPPEAAWRRLTPHLAPLGVEPVARREAGGRVLAEPLAATVDVPPADVSAMDGYAVAGEVAGRRLPVTVTVAAGDPPGAAIPEDGAARIMTGAVMPSGADRVVPVELTDGGGESVRFDRSTAAGAHIRRHAEIVAAGDEILPAGAPLTPGALALAAAHGLDPLPVYRAPRVRVLVTGDEVVPPEQRPAAGQLRDSNSDFLLAAGRGLGLAFEPLGIAGDQPEALGAAIRTGLEADVLLLTGGVSMGEFDLVEGLLAEAGCEPLFDSVAVQPGKPLVAARHPGGLVFGLPGNPASVMVCYWLFVRPALRRLLGIDDGYWHGALAGELAAPLPGARDRDRFLPAAVDTTSRPAAVRPVPPAGSHDLMAFARGTALVRVLAGSDPAPRGAPCEYLPL